MPFTLTLDTLTAGGQFTDGFGAEYVLGGPGGDDEFTLTKLTGWWDSAAPVTARTPRPTAHGAHRGAAYRGVRAVMIGVTVTCQTQNLAHVRQIEQQIAALCYDPSTLYPLTVADDAGTYVAYVELDGAILAVMHGTPGLPYSTEFSIPVAAPDPRRFTPGWTAATSGPPTAGSGGVISTGGGVISTGGGIVSGIAAAVPLIAAIGAGTVANPLVFKIIGAGSNFVISDIAGSSQISYAGALGATDTVWLNMDDQPAYEVPGLSAPIPARGAVLNGGSNARSAVTVRGGWPVLRPGASATYLLSGSLGAGASLTVYSRGALA